MNSTPLVSVICLCYNHERFVEGAVISVLQQTYQHIELIIVDDASTDGSKGVIAALVQQHPEIKFLSLETNVGNCKAFNQGLALSKGQFIIDLAADDILLPARVECGVKALLAAGPDFGLNFTDAEWISEEGSCLYVHSQRFPHATIPQGDVYHELITRYFICSPTMIFTRDLITALNGYDENLFYEDFDLWIRGSRTFKFCYTSEVLVRKRLVNNSKSQKQFTRKDPQRYSTFTACTRILQLNRSKKEQKALKKRIWYEIKLCLKVFDLKLVMAYLRLLRKNRLKEYSY